MFSSTVLVPNGVGVGVDRDALKFANVWAFGVGNALTKKKTVENNVTVMARINMSPIISETPESLPFLDDVLRLLLIMKVTREYECYPVSV